MRIISGKYKSRKIFSALPAKENCTAGSRSNLRPTTDRARESLFNVLNNHIDFDRLKCLDLFAGTGSFGFECVSRGAESCDFVEQSGKQVQMIDKTAKELGCEEKINTYKQDVLYFLKENPGSFYDLMFADPPYDYDKYDELINLILSYSFSIFILEYSTLKNPVIETDRYTIIDKKAGITNFKIFITK